MPVTSIYYPFNQGLREDLSERASAAPPMMTELRNVRIDKRGDYVARGGFQPLTMSALTVSSSADRLRYMASTGRELIGVTPQDLWAYLDVEDRWVYRGPAPIGTGRVRTAFRGGPSHSAYDVDGDGDYALGVAEVRRRDDSDTRITSTVTQTIALRLTESVDGQLLADTADEYAGDTPRSVVHGTIGHPLWLTGSSGARTIRSLPYTMGTSNPGLPLDLVSGDVRDNTSGPYDARGVDTSTWVLGYIRDTSHDIRLVLCNGTPATTGTQVIISNADAGWDYQQLAIDVDVTGGHVYTLAAAVDGDDVSHLVLYRHDLTTLALDWGPVEIDTPDAGSRHTNLGVQHAESGGADVVGCIWTEHDDAMGSPLASSAYRQASDGAAVSGTTIERAYNVVTISRPWWHEGRMYSGCVTHLAHSELVDNPASTGIATLPPVGTYPGSIWDLDLVVRWSRSPADVGTQTPVGYRIVGAYNLGYARSGYDRGNTASVYSPEAGVYAWGGIAKSRVSVDYSPAYMADEVRVDTRGTPIIARVGDDGAAIIGGTMVMWYDGETTQELGQLTSPIPTNVSTASTGGSWSQNDQVYYTASWLTYDAAGYLHRGAPSYTWRHEVLDTGSVNQIDEIRYASSPSNRRDVRPNQLDLYRGDTADIMRQVVPEDLAIEDDGSDWETPDFADLGSVKDLSARPLLYITGGEVEATHPEGAQIPIVHDGAVWLGGSWRGGSIAHSKDLSRGVSSAVRIAPEFSEGFVLPLTGDDEVTGMGAIDDKLVVLTRLAVYMVVGERPGPNGLGGSLSGARRVSSDAGCIDPRSVVSYPGGVIYQGPAGLYQLDRGGSVRLLGDPVRDIIAAYPVVTSAVVVPDDSHVRIGVRTADGTDGRLVIYDYRAEAWMVWHIHDGEGETVTPAAAALHRDVYYLASTTGAVYRYDPSTTTDDGTVITRVVQTGWLQLAGHGGYQRLQRIHLLGERAGAAAVQMTVATNFDPGSPHDQTYTWSDADIASLPRTPDVVCRLRVRQQKANAHRVTITDTGTGAGLRLSGLRMDVVARRDAAKAAPAQA